jgi:hypothetical protein
MMTRHFELSRPRGDGPGLGGQSRPGRLTGRQCDPLQAIRQRVPRLAGCVGLSRPEPEVGQDLLEDFGVFNEGNVSCNCGNP